MNNAYKSVIVEMSVGDREYLLLEATASNTLVKQVAYFYRTQASVATLYIQKKNGSVIEVNSVNAPAAQSVDLNTDVIALELGDRVIVSSDRVSALDVGHASAMYVESTYLPSNPSILALTDVSLSTTDGYTLTWDDATQTAIWSESTGGSETLDGLTDTNIVDPLEHDSLIYDSVSAKWVNGIPTDIPVINTSGSALTAGTPVRANGVQGDRIIAAKYTPLTDPKLFIGLVAEDIPAGGTGFVRQIGMIHHLNTSGFQIGDILYPITSLGGGLLAMSTTPPTPPQHPIPCAIVLRVHENTGRVYVRTWSPTYKLTELGDVYTPTLADGDTMVWNATNFRWEVGSSVPSSLGDIRDVTDYDPALLNSSAALRWSPTTRMWELVPPASNYPSASEIKNLYESNAGTNEFSDAEQTKLAGIAEGAEANVQSDWNATSGDAEILNKPAVPSSLIELGDTPSAYGTTGQVLKVNATEDGFEFADDGGGEISEASVMQATKYNQQSLTTTFSTIINWDSEYYDDGDWFNPSTGVITLTSAGTYLITLDLTTGIANTSTTRSESQVRMMLDGVELQGFRRGLYNRTEGADEASASITLVWKKEDSNPQYITFEAARSFGSAEIAVIDASVAIATLGGATGPEGPQGAAGDTFGVVTSATGRTLALTDNLAYIRSTSSSGVTFTIPPQSSVAWHDDTEIVFEQTGAGQITIAPGAGVTLNTSETALSGQQWAVMGLKRVAEDEWTLTGERQAL